MFNDKRAYAEFQIKRAAKHMQVVTFEQIEGLLSVQFTDDVLREHFNHELRLGESELRVLGDTHILMPGFPISINDMEHSEEWKKMTCRSAELGGWILMRKTPAKFGTPILAGESIANIHDVFYADFIHKKLFGKPLFDFNGYETIRTSDTWEPFCKCRAGYNQYPDRRNRIEELSETVSKEDFMAYVMK